MAPAQTNATLTKATRGGRTEEPGASIPEGAGAPIFEGAARVYYQEKRERVVTNAGREIFVRRILILDTREPAVEWVAGDVLTFIRDRGGAEVLATVETIAAAELGELAGSGVETTRLELKPRK